MTDSWPLLPTRKHLAAPTAGGAELSTLEEPRVQSVDPILSPWVAGERREL
jgi:hypothetical protein